MTVTAVLRMSPVPAHALSLLPLETVYRILQCVSASCDWFLTSVEALPHREATLVLSPSPCMHVSLLYQARSLEDQLQLQEAAHHHHRYRVYWLTLTWPITITCSFSPSNYLTVLYVFHWHCCTLCRSLVVLLWWKQQGSVSSLQSGSCWTVEQPL